MKQHPDFFTPVEWIAIGLIVLVRSIGEFIAWCYSMWRYERMKK